MKYIKYIIPVIFLLFFLKSVSSAAVTNDEIIKLDNAFYDVYSEVLGNQNATQIITRWADTLYSDYYLYSGKYGNAYYFILVQDDNRLNNGVLTCNNGDLFYYRSSSTGYTNWNNFSQGITLNNGYMYGTYSSFYSDIDFDDVYYSANIPVPNITVTYSTISDGSIPNVPLYVQFDDRDNLSGFYIDYRVQFVPVNFVSVNVSRGNVTYSRIDPDREFVTYDVIKNSDLQSIDTLYWFSNSDNYMSRYKDVMSSKWSQFLDDYSPETDVQFTFPTNLNSAMQNMYKSKYFTIRTTQTMFGNYMRIWVRYFIIDEDNKYTVGPWRVWESYDSSFSSWGSTFPDYYSYGKTAVGTTNIYSDENADTDDEIPMNVGVPTGDDNPDTQVQVNQNVPNYPDYPTAVSYNHDNILVKFIQTANYLPQMFAGFAAFLGSAFVFIPQEIWSIIGFGFLCSIVIMIVKVL